MRDFSRTAEPHGAREVLGTGHRFVIQQHGVDPGAFTTATVPRRLATLAADPWQAITKIQQSLTPSAWRAVGGRAVHRRHAGARR